MNINLRNKYLMNMLSLAMARFFAIEIFNFIKKDYIFVNICSIYNNFKEVKNEIISY
ncbi:hypothetical protein [Metamycoplasma phocicerebrale]|uniref:hypothetical protein n=1 Tax=Metamycoplasma phocicerebrale TaxID=142649 RepID=UPI0015868F8A|nr:hypothetical protein [Metamycoplasma phocicerebrale]